MSMPETTDVQPRTWQDEPPPDAPSRRQYHRECSAMNMHASVYLLLCYRLEDHEGDHYDELVGTWWAEPEATT